MERFAGSPIPAIAVAHIAALTTASAAPVFRGAGLLFRWRADGERSAFVDPAWPSSPAAILRGWQPRRIEPANSLLKTVSQRLVAFFDHLADWSDHAKSRRALLAMDDHALRDIGIDRATAEYEGSLPFWRFKP